MDITKLLEKDHQAVKALFKEASSQEKIDRNLVNQICDSLILHTDVEEKLVYPEAAQLEKAEEITKESYEEHRQAKKMIVQLQGGSLEETQFKVTLETLQLAIEHHVEEEEAALFPILRAELPQDKLDELGEAAEAFISQKLNNPLLKK